MSVHEPSNATRRRQLTSWSLLATRLDLAVIDLVGFSFFVSFGKRRPEEIGELRNILRIEERPETVSFHAVASSPSDYAQQIKDDIAVWGKVMKDANIPVN